MLKRNSAQGRPVGVEFIMIRRAQPGTAFSESWILNPDNCVKRTKRIPNLLCAALKLPADCCRLPAEIWYNGNTKENDPVWV